MPGEGNQAGNPGGQDTLSPPQGREPEGANDQDVEVFDDETTEWLSKKGFSNTSDVVKALRELEKNHTKVTMELSGLKKQAPPAKEPDKANAGDALDEDKPMTAKQVREFIEARDRENARKEAAKTEFHGKSGKILASAIDDILAKNEVDDEDAADVVMKIIQNRPTLAWSRDIINHENHVNLTEDAIKEHYKEIAQDAYEMMLGRRYAEDMAANRAESFRDGKRTGLMNRQLRVVSGQDGAGRLSRGGDTKNDNAARLANIMNATQ